jgi:hypothetical protein
MGFVPSSDYEGPVIPQKYDESTDYDYDHPRLCKPSAEGEVKLTTAVTEKALGTIVNKPKAGGDASVRLLGNGGVMKVQLGGTVALDDYLTPNPAGLAIKATDGSAQFVFGRALKAGVENDVISFEPMTAVLGEAVGVPVP